ncbi:MAG: lysylphosphatidylglycerol synthase domain-containing protein [Gammaproteobacteria bacterium]
MSQTARRVTRAALALCIVAWLAHSVGFEQIVDQFKRASLPLLLAATVLLALDGVAKARNWQQLLLASVEGCALRLRRVMGWHYAGGFVGAIVPSSASTDACRVWMAMSSLGGHGAPCAASILTVNCLGWFSGSVVGLVGIGLLAYEGSLPRMLQPAVLVFLFTIVALPVFYSLLAAKRRLGRSPDRANRPSLCQGS